MPAIPHYQEDFYDDAFIQDPWPHYAHMRSLGPVVYLPLHDNYALTRHPQVQSALRDHHRFCSGKGVAGDRFGCEFLQGNTVASDDPRHSELRRAMAPPLFPGALEDIRDRVQLEADGLIDRLLATDEFDAMADLARHLPLAIVRDMVGLPTFGQENMLKWAAAAFDVLGRQNDRGKAAVPAIGEMRAFIDEAVATGKLAQESWTGRILALVDEGLLSADLAPFATRDYINPSLDTTISATGELIWQIANNPDQWECLKQDPELCGNAVNEAVRLCSPIRSFSRHTTREIEVDGYIIPPGARVMMLFASANRDETVFADPDAFRLDRNPRVHLGFGSGIHMCIGMHLAELEMTALLRSMIPRVGRIHVGKPVIAMNNSIRAFSSLPARFEAEERTIQTAGWQGRKPLPEKLLKARIRSREIIAANTVLLTLEPQPGVSFPVPQAGAHIDVYVQPGLVRQYSLTGRLEDNCYRLAVQKEQNSRGGSIAMFKKYQPGSQILIGAPLNNFPLHPDAKNTVLFAGGIGITPLLAMAWQLYLGNRPFSIHVSVRSRARLAFAAELETAPFASEVHIHVDDEQTDPINIRRILSTPMPGTHIYVCGPSGYMDFIMSEASISGIPADRIHREFFAAEIDVDGEPFELVAARSNRKLVVAAHESILASLERAGIAIPTSCENGLCGTCLTTVLAGSPDHRDLVQTDAEKATNRKIAVCCSRSRSKRLVLDL